MNNKILIIIGVVVLVAVGAFVLMQSQKNTQQTNTTPTDQSITQTPVDDSTKEHSDDSMTDDSSMSEDTLSESDTSDADATVKTFKVSASNFEYNVKSITVKKGDTVKIEFINSEGFHDWRLDGYGKEIGTKQLQAGQSETVEFVADKAGEFEFYCSVGQHRQMGMVGKLIVEE